MRVLRCHNLLRDCQKISLLGVVLAGTLVVKKCVSIIFALIIQDEFFRQHSEGKI